MIFFGATNSGFHGAKSRRILILSVFVVGTFYSYLISGFYISGDQEWYFKAYESISGKNFIDALNSYQKVLDTSELMHFFLTWIVSSLNVSKNVFMSFSNGVLAGLLTCLLLRNGLSPFLALSVIFSSYYLNVLFFDLERLKFAFIFLLAYLIYPRLWLLGSAVFSHALTVIPIMLGLPWKYVFLKNGLLKKQGYSWVIPKWKLAFFFGTLFFLVVSLLWDHIAYRVTYYYKPFEFSSLSDICRLGIFYGLTMLTSRQKIKASSFFVGLMILAILFGDSRLNMLGYFGFLYYSNFRNKLFPVIIFPVILYFLFKSTVYIWKLYLFGQTG